MIALSLGKPFLTVEETAELLRCSVCTVRRAIASRRLASVKLSGRHGRTLIRAEDLNSYVERSRLSAVGESQS